MSIECSSPPKVCNDSPEKRRKVNKYEDILPFVKSDVENAFKQKFGELSARLKNIENKWCQVDSQISHIIKQLKEASVEYMKCPHEDPISNQHPISYQARYPSHSNTSHYKAPYCREKIAYRYP